MNNINENDVEKLELVQLQTTNELLREMIKNQKEQAKNAFKVHIATVICFTVVVIVGIISFFVYEAQFETEYTQTFTTQEVSGENSEINNVTGDMYKDNAQHNEY